MVREIFPEEPWGYVKDIPNRECNRDKSMEVVTSCHVQRLAGGLVGLMQECMVRLCPVPGMETDTESEPDAEGPCLLC